MPRHLAVFLGLTVVAAAACVAAPVSTPATGSVRPASAGPGAVASGTSRSSPGTTNPEATAVPVASEPAGTPPIPGLSWVKAPDVARPGDAFAEPSAAPTAPSGPGTAGHPGHFPGQAIVDDVARLADGSLVAVGYVGLDGVWRALAWRSTDALHWALDPLEDAPASFAVAITVDPTAGTPLAAGRTGPLPVVWFIAPDGGWARRTLPTLSRGAEWERVVTIVATGRGLLAGGSAGPELGARRARLWRSADGASWTPIPDNEAFAGGEVVAIEPLADRGYVAIGHLGTGQRATGSVAWLSDDAVTWRRVDDPSLASGLVNAIATDADGSIVAVGSDPDEREALVWRSADGGATWQQAPGEASRLYEPYRIRMTDVVSTPGGLVAVGNYVGLQYGTATSWVATDWTHWTRAPNHPALGQGEMLAVAKGGPGLVAVGSFGAPDNYVPTIWLGDLPGG
jgi:hypothetical protein